MIRVCVNGFVSAMRPSGHTYFKTMRLFRYLCVIDAHVDYSLPMSTLCSGELKNDHNFQFSFFERLVFNDLNFIQLHLTKFITIIYMIFFL